MIFFSCFSPIFAATISVSNLPVGKVIKIGSKSFTKVRQDPGKGAQFLALTPFSYQQIFNYTGGVQTWTVPYSGTYQIELWGSRAGYGAATVGATYVSGSITLASGENLYLYIGNRCSDIHNTTCPSFNGGGTYGYGVGGGATDIRLVSGNWSDTASLNSRVAVAAGAGTPGWMSGGNDFGGGLIADGYTVDATQVAGHSFGIGCSGVSEYQGAGGGGYYGGGCGINSRSSYAYSGGGGGSSFISGHPGCVAITSATDQTPKSGCTTGTSDYNCSLHYSGKVFTNTVMIDGAGYSWTNVKGNQVVMPNPAGGSYALGVGHSGNGVARITLI